MNTRRNLAALAIVLVCFPVGPIIGEAATPIGQQIGVTVEAGLNERTLRELDKFTPQEFHDQAMATIKEALPLLQQNVDEFLARATWNMENVISTAQCVAYGTSAQWKQEATHLLSSPHPIEIFKDDQKKRMYRVTSSYTPREYSEMYGDLHHEANVLWCELLDEKWDAERSRKEISDVHLLWGSLVDDGCSDARNCVEKLRKEMNILKSKSDPLDLKFVKFEDKLAAVPPNPPIPGTVRATAMKVAFFDPVPYEAVLKPLVKIKEELALAKIGREQLAKDLMADATERVQTAVKEVNFGWDDLALQPAMPCYVGVFPAKIEAAHRQADVVYAVCNKEDGPLFVNRSLDAEKLIGSSNNPISTCRVVDRELALASAFDSSSQKAAADDLRFSVNAVENRYQRIKNATEIKPYMIPGCTAH